MFLVALLDNPFGRGGRARVALSTFLLGWASITRDRATKALGGGNMPRWFVLVLGTLIAPALCACGGASTPPGASSDEDCPLVDAGPPPVCTAGCTWNGSACKKTRGIIIDFERGDAGSPPGPVSQ